MSIHTLPIQLTSFIGREQEIADINALLLSVRPSAFHSGKREDIRAQANALDDAGHIGGARLLCLTGAGGTGKTRLALRVARELQDHFADGVWWVGLAPMEEPTLVPQAVASALGLREQFAPSVVKQLSEFLHTKELLLVLDNCEHLVAACAPLIETLLGASPKLQILATSRESLGIAGETIWVVPPLSFPSLLDLEGTHPAPHTLAHYEAVRLFVAGEHSPPGVCPHRSQRLERGPYLPAIGWHPSGDRVSRRAGARAGGGADRGAPRHLSGAFDSRRSHCPA
ncbi:MAG: ATP-binding protein [Ardenticatenaceae bacterium]